MFFINARTDWEITAIVGFSTKAILRHTKTIILSGKTLHYWMNAYTLDDKTMDSAFLKGETVTCRAVLSAAEQSEKILREGDPLLVFLSTGSKYKGILQRVSIISTIQGRTLTELEIIRYMPA